MSRVVRTLFIFIFLIAMGMPAISARQAQDPGTPPAPQKMDKDTNKQQSTGKAGNEERIVERVKDQTSEIFRSYKKT